MDVDRLREVINCTAEVKARDISLNKLSECLKVVDENMFSSNEAVSDTLWKITCQYYLVLTQFADKCVENNSTSAESIEKISLHDQTSFLVVIDLVRQFTLHLYLPQELRELSRSDAQLRAIVEQKERVQRLSYCVAQFRYLFDKKMLVLHPMMSDCAIDFIAGTYSLSAESALSQMKSIEFPKQIMLRCLLMIKGCKELSIDLCEALHRDLLELIGDPGGFSILCRTLLTVNRSDANAPAWYKSEIIAKIVTRKGHKKNFYRQVLTDCFATFREAIYAKSEDALAYANTCLECIKRFYQLPAAYSELHKRIESYFFGRFQVLISPEEPIIGYVLVEQSKLLADLYECRMAFAGSSITSLPSSILTRYLPLFLSLYSILPPSSHERNYLQDMIIFCLANRTKKELQNAVLLIAMDQAASDNFTMHSRIIMKQTTTADDYALQIGPASNEKRFEGRSSLPSLVLILKSANHNLLIYDVFVILLSELMTSTKPTISLEDSVLVDEIEKEDMLCKRFYKKIVLIQSLTELISHKNFHNQMYDNPDEILKVLESSVAHLMKSAGIDNGPLDNKREDILDIVLTLLRDFFKRIRNCEKMGNIFKLLQRYKSSKECSDQLKIKIDNICNTSTVDYDDDDNDTPCQNALSLCADQEPYCKVHGTTLLLKLLKERDDETIAERHTILILALENLRSEESYSFLNSVRLLVALTDVLESETVEAVLKEYHNVENHMDYKLKIGEATVKIVEALGPFAIRYRDELLNCFLAGTQSTCDEFRTSSLSNIGNICRILSYQVHHFFYELFLNICKIMEADKYVPARRASILVLSQLIQGIEGLMDLQEYLLSIYRLLKHVIATDKDDVTKLQAALALDYLKSKAVDFFTMDPADLERRMFEGFI
uniref:RNA polymerase II assembly factor Rtp1 C-terminal domain-containing protein n=1 Tax=Anopheles atroparvus TaxID=41427 RepID=A0A182IRL2_ANOAO